MVKRAELADSHRIDYSGGNYGESDIIEVVYVLHGIPMFPRSCGLRELPRNRLLMRFHLIRRNHREGMETPLQRASSINYRVDIQSGRC